jgi:thiamine biosynthesis lipoprotein
MQRIDGLSMGGGWSLWLPAVAGAAQARGLVQEVLDRVEGQMSAWRPESVLCRVNEAPLGTWVDLPAEMAAVAAAGLALMRAAPGSFSVLMGGAAAREGFQPGRARPTSADPGAVEFDGHRIRRLADVALDLNAIAKGFAADLAVETLVRAGFDHLLLEVAGDIRAHGPRPDRSPWNIALELPIPDRSVPARLIPLAGGAVATSGGYRRARGAASHLIDPATGQPREATDASVAVVADTALQADGWATVMAILGPERGLALAEDRRLPAVFIAPAAGGFVERGSAAMARLLGQDL